MFDAMADWMTVPLLQQEAGEPPKRIGLAHTSISPYGAFREPRRRRHPDLDPERPRMARAGGKGPGRRRARRRSRLRHQCRARQAPRRDRWQGRGGVRARSTPTRWSKNSRPPISPSPASNGTAELARHPHLRRITVGTPSGPGVLSGAGRTARLARRGTTARCRRSASTRDRVRAEFMPATIDAK